MKEDNIVELLTQWKADAVLILNRYNMRYITGYSGDTGIVYFSKSKKMILTDFRYVYQAQAEADGFEVLDIEGNGYAKTVSELAKADDVKVIAFEGEELRYSDYLSYKKSLNSIEMIPIGDELSELRMIKTPYELEQIKMAEHIGDLVFSEILNFIKPGISELQVAARIEYLLKEKGGEGLSFPAIVASGVNSSMPHAVPGRKLIESGDLLTMDFGCIYNGYCSDMTRTVVVGKANEKQKEIYYTVLRAQNAVLDVVKAGMTGKDLDKIARDLIDDAGFSGCFGHGLGHSVGLYIHESPRASQKYEKTVEENMTLTVEPGIYVKDFGGVRIEDLVVVTKEGCLNFTKSRKELIEL